MIDTLILCGLLALALILCGLLALALVVGARITLRGRRK